MNFRENLLFQNKDNSKVQMNSKVMKKEQKVEKTQIKKEKKE